MDRKKFDTLFTKAGNRANSSTPYLECGRLLTAELIIVGRAYHFNKHLELLARIIDTETGVVLALTDVFGPVDTLRDVHLIAEGLSLKFKQAFPLREGHVVDKNPESVCINLGEKDNVFPYMRVIFFREDKPAGHPKNFRKKVYYPGRRKD